MSQEFWMFLQNLADRSEIVLDRPKGSSHPRYPGKVYPVDYGYLKGTTSSDEGGVDVWVGSQERGEVIGVLCTVDLFKRDTELKLLIGCSDHELSAIDDFVNTDQMRAMVIKREKMEK